MKLAVPNERPEPMNAFEATVPAGFRIVDARPVDGWTVQVDESTARWRGGPLAHLAIETFVLEVEVDADPGVTTLGTRQLYPSGAQVRWPADLRIVPRTAAAAGEPSRSVWVLIGLGVVAASLALGAALVLRQRSRAHTLRV